MSFGEKTNVGYEILTNEKPEDKSQLTNEKIEEMPQFADYLQQGIVDEDSF
jgi:hypothetical protein